jgi:hypothetical protein
MRPDASVCDGFDRSVGVGRGRLGTRRPIDDDGSHQDDWAAIDAGLALDAPLTRHRMICHVAYGAGARTATAGGRRTIEEPIAPGDCIDEQMRAIPALLAALLAVGCQRALPNQPGHISEPPPSSAPVVPTLAWKPAVDAVVEAFVDHSVVAIGEIHGSRAIHAVLQEILGEPRLVGVLNDVAVEFGSARHQATIDRYVKGEEVSATELELVWTDTTQRTGVWNNPVYREFFERVRGVNSGRRAADRIRVLLGDPPIDWDAITDTDECAEDDPHCLDHWLFRRDDHFAAVVRDASLAHGRRVLVIAGVGHVRRHAGAGTPLSLTDSLDASHPGATWTMLAVDWATIRNLADELAARDSPLVAAVLPLSDGVLADLPAGAAFDRGTVTCDNPPCEEPDAPIERLGAVADALFVP